MATTKKLANNQKTSWMHRTMMGLSVLFALLIHPTGAHAQDFSQVKSKLNKRGLDIRVGASGWGDADKEDVERVLYSVAAELEPYFPHGKLPPIKVEHGNDTPIVLFEKVAGGQYVIQLTAKGRHWSQLAYQFAHELTHVLSNFDNNAIRESKSSDPNQWFEEAICEAASLFALKQMAVTWEVAPPYEQWKAYAPSLRRYADEMKRESHRELPAGMTLASWFGKNESIVRDDPYRRANNEVVATRLLALLEQQPQSWGAISYLNHDKDANAADIREYLQYWYEDCPDAYKGFVRQVMAELGVSGQATGKRLASARRQPTSSQ
ncbi:MAG: hypothetical protein WCC58_07585 [Burkholderiales bacterium]